MNIITIAAVAIVSAISAVAIKSITVKSRLCFQLPAV